MGPFSLVVDLNGYFWWPRGQAVPRSPITLNMSSSTQPTLPGPFSGHATAISNQPEKMDSGRHTYISAEPNIMPLSCPNTVDRRDFDTPREDQDDFPSLGPVPASPGNNRKSKSRAGRVLNRDNSLKESKVLLVTNLKRSDSVLRPDLFQYHSHFDFLGVIGRTQISEVFRVRHRQTGEIFAVKRSRRRFRSKLQRERCLREIRAVAALPPHPNIVAQYRAWQEDSHFYIQMDYCEGGSLHQLVQHAQQQGQPLSDEQLHRVAADVAAGLAFLHSHGVLHLDIKPENIYRNLGPDGAPAAWRIGDFGLAVAKETHDWEEGDGEYVAPELLQAGCEPSPAADVFSLGATLCECATGRKLPRREGSAEAADIALPQRPTELVSLLRAMLRADPAARPTAAQLLECLNHSSRTEAAEEQQQHTPEAACAALTVPDVGGFTFDAALRGGESGAGATPEAAFAAGKGAPAAANAAAGPQAAVVRNPHLPKWAPLLSPLISEGALTPGAAAGLVGLTPPTVAHAAAGAGKATAQLQRQRGALRRLPPLRLPPQQQQHSARTADNNSFSLRRRELASPGPETASESEGCSFSCDTLGSASDLEFADMLSPVGRGASPAEARSGAVAAAAAATTQAGPACACPSLAPLLAWELRTSPELFAHLPGSSPAAPPGEAGVSAAPSQPNSLEASPSGALSSRSYGSASLRRFPTLDSMPSMQLDSGRGSAEKTRDSLVALAAQRFTNNFAQLAAAPRKGGASSGMLVPPLLLPAAAAPKTLRRKRQHSSRRALVHALSGGELGSSRSVGMSSSRSIDLLMPHKKEARHACFDAEDADDDAGEPLQMQSGPPTQRSSRGPPTARMAALLEQQAANAGALEAKCGGRISAAAAAAARIHEMTLNDVCDGN